MEFQVAKGVPFVMDDFLTEGKARSSGLFSDYFSSGAPVVVMYPEDSGKNRLRYVMNAMNQTKK